jgi:tyrosine-protein phosphatase SIW14
MLSSVYLRTTGTTVLLLTLACSALAADQPVNATAVVSSSHAVARKITTEGLPNFAEVTPTLYRGAQPSQAGLTALAKMNVAIVVDLRASRNDGEAKTVERLGMRYVSIPWRCYAPRDENFAQLLNLVRENPGKKIFVHCRLGEDRTGMAIAAYRISEENWTADEAMKEMQAFGFSSFHHALCPGLAGYEKKFPVRLKKNSAFQTLRSEASAGTTR